MQIVIYFRVIRSFANSFLHYPERSTGFKSVSVLALTLKYL